jgi:hypothetical protein
MSALLLVIMAFYWSFSISISSIFCRASSFLRNTQLHVWAGGFQLGSARLGSHAGVSIDRPVIYYAAFLPEPFNFSQLL